MIDITEITKLSLKSIIRNKVRSFLTALGIIIGVASVILLISLGNGLQKYITGQFESLGSNLIYILPGKVGGDDGSASFSQGAPNFAGSKLTVSMVEKIQNLGDPIKLAAADDDIPAKVSYRGKSKFTTVGSISDTWSKIVNIEIEDGRGITKADVDAQRKVVVLGKSIAEDLFGVSESLGKELTIGEDKFVVIGIIKEIGSQGIGFDIDNFVAIPITTAQTIFDRDSINSIIVQATSKEEIPDTIDKLKKYMKTQIDEDDFSVVDQSKLLETINAILGVITTALGGIAAISLVVGGVGIMNIMLVSVTERTREIGLRKAIGAKPSDILSQFIIEAVTLSLVGGGIGVLIGAGGAFIINNFFPTSVTLWSVMLAFGVSALVGIVFGVAPAIRASRLDPIEALRYE